MRFCSHIIVDVNLERETLGSIARLKAEGGALLAAEPVSVAKAEKLLGLPCPADLITPNLDELTALAGYPVHTAGDMETACRGLSARFNHILVTLGREGAYHFDAAAGRGKRYPAYKAEITDATGAGDSFTGGVVYALAAGFSMDECIRTGMAAAVLSLESEQTVCGGISLESVRDIMKTRRVLP
ncbi:MAG: hypothetical protein E4H36_10485 [Spirochaetales bacterium]|nr:MAG: hypothetical protein E4H36_10485 [Spirochaetales bacterium]